MLAAIAAAVIGLWLALSPALLNYTGPAETNAHVVGPIAATFAMIAIAQATGQVRLLNVPLGLWLVVAPMVFAHSWIAVANSVGTGLILAALSVLRGRQRYQQGGGWAALWPTAQRP